MIQGVIIQGTTPEHEFVLPFEVSQIRELRVSYGQKGREVLVKYDEDCVFSGKSIKVKLTQEDTFLFNDRSVVEVQIKALKTNEEIYFGEGYTYRVKAILNNEIL